MKKIAKSKTEKRKICKRILLVFSIVITLCFLSLGIGFTVIYNKYDLDIAKLTSANNGIKIVSASGEEANLFNTDRPLVEIETLPDYVLNAVIDTEDFTSITDMM